MTRAEIILEKYINLKEASARRTISFRGGSRHIRFACPPGYMKKAGSRSCARITASRHLQNSRALKKSWRKRRGNMGHQRMAAKKTFRKMRQLGYKRVR